MPIPGYKQLCLLTTPVPGDLCITLPGGMEVCASVVSSVPFTAAELVQDMLGKLNTAMAPLQPVFNIIDAVLAIFDCVCAIATLRPSKILKCIPNLAEKIDKLIKLVPALSIPVMILGFLDSLIMFLQAQVASIESAISYLNYITSAELATQDNDVDISFSLDCAKGNLDTLLLFQGEQNSPVNRLIGLVNAFLKLLGLPCIPALPRPELTSQFKDLLQKMADFLQFLRSAITIPIPTISSAISSEDC